MGTSTAYHFAKAGRRVLLLEQFAMGHKRGSSHGGTRMIRHIHSTPDYAAIMPATYALWRELERESGQKLLVMSGGLFIAPPNDGWNASCRAVMQQYGYPLQALTTADLRNRYPQFQVEGDFDVLLDENAGLLAADRCLLAMAEQARRYNAEIREHAQVLSVQPASDSANDGASDGVRVQFTQNGVTSTVYADTGLVTAGPWAKGFVDALIDFEVTLKPTFQQVAYFKTKDADSFQPDRFPVFIFNIAPNLYGFPVYEKPGHVKIGREFFDTEIDPNAPRQVDQAELAALSADVARVFPQLDPTPVDASPCLYTETPNRDFVIDRHPQHPQILFAAGFSGRGFKFSINVGKLLLDLATSAPGTYDSCFWLDAYAIDRFRQAGRQRLVVDIFSKS